MGTAICFSFAPLKSSKPHLFCRRGSLNQGRFSSKILSMSQNEHLTSSSPGSVSHTENHEVTRRPTVNFPPTAWDDRSLSSSSPDLASNTRVDKKIEDLKNEVKIILRSTSNDPSPQLVFIDKIQRLGIEYHFEAEIDTALQHIYDNTAHEDGDLNIVGLRFRLLRQAGHFVSPGVFTKFMDEKGKFKSSLKHDWRGLLSLYEAAHLGCKEESVLDEAIAFSTKHLSCLASQLDPDITSQVQRSLLVPLRKRIPRVEATYYMSLCENVEGSKNDVLLQLAKMDYNALQLMHQTELKQLSRWWKESKILSSLPFQARDRLVEGYAIFMSIIPEPKYSAGRLFNAKLYTLFTVFDDIFDVYGIIPELEPITDAVTRWDVMNEDELPEFAKVVVLELFNVFNEIEEEMAMRGLDYSVPYFKRENQYYFGCALDETKLMLTKTVPPLKEWLQLSMTTKGGKYMIIGLVLAHWDLVTKEAMDWSISETKGNYSCAQSCRIIGDIATFKFEQERGIMVSSITCYMKEHGVPEHEAIEKLRKMVDDGWKVMNEECLNPTTIIPMGLLMIPINIMRMLQFAYMYGGDGFTNPGGHVKEMIASLLVNPVPT